MQLTVRGPCRYHEERGDKILIFSDRRFALEKIAVLLNRPLIHGDTNDAERLFFLHRFMSDSKGCTLCASVVGDSAIDLPDANVLIQVRPPTSTPSLVTLFPLNCVRFASDITRGRCPATGARAARRHSG
jgi:superfamily II DNA or RNA helicase